AKFLTGLVIGAAIGAAVAMLVVVPQCFGPVDEGIGRRLANAMVAGQEMAGKKEAEMWAKFREQTKLPEKKKP
ncbi:MAG: hypothetical protein M1319_01585, partial [Chloroflexi bacterium]|nr:hypothetical protein [Chloroflexota bacterium]